MSVSFLAIVALLAISLSKGTMYLMYTRSMQGSNAWKLQTWFYVAAFAAVIALRWFGGWPDPVVCMTAFVLGLVVAEILGDVIQDSSEFLLIKISRWTLELASTGLFYALLHALGYL